jgi:ferredoxin
MKVPVVDLSRCSLCGACIEVCPLVFRMNEAGYIEVIELPAYPEAEVNEAIKYCPEDCIYWEDDR